MRRASAVHPSAAAVIAPYAAWNGFATALNASIAARNRSGRATSGSAGE